MWLLIAFVRCYQLFISPLFPPSCRHEPSCSQYAIEAVKEYGVKAGLLFSIKRVLSCHPWGTYGYYPVIKKADHVKHPYCQNHLNSGLSVPLTEE